MVRSRDMGNRSYDKERGIWMGRIGNYNLQPGRDSIRQNIHTVVARQQFGQRIRWITYLPLTLRFLSFLISTPYILEEEWAVVSLGDLHGLRFFFLTLIWSLVSLDLVLHLCLVPEKGEEKENFEFLLCRRKVGQPS